MRQDCFFRELTMRLVCPICSKDAVFAFDGQHYKVAICTNINCGHLFAINPSPKAGEKNVFPRHWQVRDERLVSYLLSRNFFNQHSGILDVGAGPGFLLQAIKKILPDVHITCVEPSSFYTESLHCCEFSVYSNIEQIPEGKSYTSVIVKEVIEHVPNPLETLKKIKAVLSNTGEVFVSTPVGDFFPSSPHKHKLHTYTDPYHIHFFTRRSLEYCLRQAGFNHIRYCYVDSFYPADDNSLAAVNERTKNAYRKFFRGEPFHLTYFAGYNYSI